jgi:hypothetical protein
MTAPQLTLRVFLKKEVTHRIVKEQASFSRIVAAGQGALLRFRKNLGSPQSAKDAEYRRAR